MRVSARTRAIILALTLAATLAAGFAPDDPLPASGKAAVVAPTVRRQTTELIRDVPDIVIRRLTEASPKADPFSPDAWLPPPPPPQSEPAPPPTAPPFPYAYLGRVDDSGKASVLLGGSSRSVTAQAGDLIDGVWRVDTIAEHSVELVYQPLDQRQTLSAGSPQ